MDRSTERLLKTFQNLKDNGKAILGNFFGQEAVTRADEVIE